MPRMSSQYRFKVPKTENIFKSNILPSFSQYYSGYAEPFLRLTSLAEFGEHWFERMNDAPDLAFRFETAKLRVRSDNTSTFSGNFTIHGTRLEIDGRDVTQQQVMQQHFAKKNSNTFAVSQDDNICRLLIANNTSASSSPATNCNLQQPQLVPYFMRGVINVHLDEQQLTRAVDFVLEAPVEPEQREEFVCSLQQKLGMQEAV